MKWSPAAFLVIAATAGFFGMPFLLALAPIPEESRETIEQIVGTAGNAFMLIVGYYFGSSSGSAKKTDIIAEKVE
jgi:hypothetical protein